jgi:hypothetical protein
MIYFMFCDETIIASTRGTPAALSKDRGKKNGQTFTRLDTYSATASKKLLKPAILCLTGAILSILAITHELTPGSLAVTKFNLRCKFQQEATFSGYKFQRASFSCCNVRGNR